MSGVSVGSEAHTQNVTAVLALTINAGVRLTCLSSSVPSKNSLGAFPPQIAAQ